MSKKFLFQDLEELMNYSNNYKGSDPLIKLPNIIIQNLNNSIVLNKYETEMIRLLATNYSKKSQKFPIKYLVNIENETVKEHFLALLILYFYSQKNNNFVILSKKENIQKFKNLLANNDSKSYLFAYKIQFMGKLVDIKEVNEIDSNKNKESINLYFSTRSEFLSKYSSNSIDSDFLIIDDEAVIENFDKLKNYNSVHIFSEFDFVQSSYKTGILDNFIYNYDKKKIQSINKNNLSSSKKCSLKEEFKQSDFFKNGLIFLNKKEKLDKDIKVFPNQDKKYMHHSLNEISKDFLYSKTLELKNIDISLISKYVDNYREFKLENLKNKFNKIDNVLDLFTTSGYFGDNTVEVCFNNENDYGESLNYSINTALSNIASYIHNFDPVFTGSKQFYAHNLSNIFDIENTCCDESSYKIDLSDQKWFVSTCDSFTYQQHLFLNYFKNQIVDQLNQKSIKFWLIKNNLQNEALIYTFDNATEIAPDFYLFIEKNDRKYQVLIETKENSKWMSDYWHENFFAELNTFPAFNEKDDTYKIYALPLANFDINENEFTKVFSKFIKEL
ncbi:hypothetical protein MBOVJF4428_00281 [Mycoplasmopsis agalactiae]|uniref:restriction endonuclease subunit R n=1 Tax=Mycoplasmopsis agalactiae TaxID=2110 RepID=UPI000C70722F|nr:restriction endonuclease subunit R [Mycoplasmopsis agalactiae]MCE6057110.1 restriction endonuclease subunit R [Mycoplasmopsis agalactiae]MCE6078897.1 restriction endonuclease subunit R [Mycoplasmopsis agalactiae]MCE6095282.1 restriction endonuclease subunit R [Mycoplasmopsis agalactiae]MCE6114537.1 restriction endonuclease subunit R [Mycoplasmopsis agalactiae]NLS34373.1 restriction endonuclease subunit R [Mycoplasmopsis agalactiae]